MSTEKYTSAADNESNVSSRVSAPSLALVQQHENSEHSIVTLSKDTVDDYLTEVFLTVPNWHPLFDISIDVSMKKLFSSGKSNDNSHVGSNSNIQKTLITLLKILDNVLINPKDPKKRRIRINNPNFWNRVGQNPDAIEFLHTVGFVNLGEFLDLPIAFLSRLTDARQILAEQLRSGFNILTPPIPDAVSEGCFNPFQSNVAYNATPTDARMLKQHHSEAIKKSYVLDEKISALQSRFESKANVPPVELQPLVFCIRHGRNKVISMDALLREALQKATDLTNTEEGPMRFSSEDLARLKSSLSNGSAFASRRKLEFKALERRPWFPQTTLRIQFPDDFVLELNFSSITSIGNVKGVIRTFLCEDVRTKPFFLYQAPPFRRLNSKKSLFEENLPPKSIVRFRIDLPEKDQSQDDVRGKIQLDDAVVDCDDSTSRSDSGPFSAIPQELSHSHYLDPVVAAKYWVNV